VTVGTRIHRTAIVGEGAELGVEVEVGPYCVISGRARIGDRCRLHAHAQILNRVTLGCDNVVHAGAVIGDTPQDRSYQGEETETIVGDGNQVREHVTIQMGTSKGGGVTRVGGGSLLMVGAHVAHDCVLGDNLTLGNSVMLAGHVHIEDGATIAGGTGVHHWVTVGRLAFVGGLARVTMDVPPFMISEGGPARVRGLNLVGLRRSGIDGDRLEALRAAYRTIYHGRESFLAGLQAVEQQPSLTDDVRYLVEHLRRTERGYRGRYLEGVHRGRGPVEPEEAREI
jgi:UDP-N-acetylglucosamine acyltransferase